MTVTEIRVAPGTEQFELRGKSQQFLTGRNINCVGIEGDSAQAAPATRALPFDVFGIPVERPDYGLSLEVDQADVTVLLAPVAAANN